MGMDWHAFIVRENKVLAKTEDLFELGVFWWLWSEQIFIFFTPCFHNTTNDENILLRPECYISV